MVIEVRVFNSRAVIRESFRGKELLLLIRVNWDYRIWLVDANAYWSFLFPFKSPKMIVRISILNLSKDIYMCYTKLDIRCGYREKKQTKQNKSAHIFLSESFT